MVIGILIGIPVMTSTVPAAGPSGDGILLEDGSSFLLAESGDFLIQE